MKTVKTVFPLRGIIKVLTAIIWSPTWIRPSWSTALSFVMLFTKMPEGSEESVQVVKLRVKLKQLAIYTLHCALSSFWRLENTHTNHVCRSNMIFREVQVYSSKTSSTFYKIISNIYTSLNWFCHVNNFTVIIQQKLYLNYFQTLEKYEEKLDIDIGCTSFHF